MINLLIIENDLMTAINLNNYINQNAELDIKVYNISINSNSAINIIKDLCIDLIILDLDLPNNTSLEILDYISSNTLNKYKNSIIALNTDKKIHYQLINNPYIFTLLPYEYNLNQIITEISIWQNSHSSCLPNSMLREKIINELEYLKYNLSHIGTIYIIETILELYNRSKTNYSTNLNKTIYPVIANKYNKSINNITSNITKSTINMYYNCSEETLKSFFGYNTIIEKPHSKEIIFKILHKLL